MRKSFKDSLNIPTSAKMAPEFIKLHNQNPLTASKIFAKTSEFL